MPLDCEVNIEKNAPVRLLNAVMERMDYSKLYAAYSRLGRIEYSPKILLKIMVYGYMRKQISSRALEACCRENLHFIYLLEGQRAPDHNTINRFRKNILTQEAGQDILCQLVIMLHERGLLSLEAAFIDGTKIEANANKYSFVWKKATAKKTPAKKKDAATEQNAAPQNAAPQNAAPQNAAPQAPADPMVGKPCPLCGKGVIIKGKTAYGCSNWKSGCQYRQPFSQM
mgnify:CR=1 FL=1